MLQDEIDHFDEHCLLLLEFINDLSHIDASDIEAKHHFLAEATMFRLYRNWERFVRSCFLHYCVESSSFLQNEVTSKLRCSDWATAEAILKGGNRFLDWGSVESIRKLANLVFEDGFPIVDLISPLAGTLTDLQRFRNFVAHDSKEASEGFKKSRDQYVKVGDPKPETVGGLLLYRRSNRHDITIKMLHAKTSELSTILKQL